MTYIELLRAIGQIDPKLIVDAAPDIQAPKRSKKPWVKWISIAACVCLVIVVCLLALTSMTQDLITDGLDTVYLIGGISVNMSNVFFSFFIAPIFSMVCTFLLWSIGSCWLILPIWLFRDLCIPLIHFFILRRLIVKNKIQKKSTILGAVLLLLATIIADSIILDFILLKGRNALFHLIFRLIWTVVCGILVMGHIFVLRFYRNTRGQKIAMIVSSMIVLLINAFFVHEIGPELARKFAIDGVEILLMPLSFIILSSFSYLLGHILTKRFILIKLFSWLLGIVASEFMVFYLLGVPHTPPTADGFVAFLWLVFSAIPFLFCLLGMLKAHRHRKRCET
jgi:hypothetical protein